MDVRYLLIGNYGVGNFGDEALREYFLSAFPEVQWQIVSANPGRGELPRLPFGVRSIFCTPWRRTVQAIRKCDGIVFGGGTLFTDVESAWACLLWWWHAFVARVFRKKIILAFQGIGPFRTRLGEWCARRVVRQASFVSVRDAVSFRRVQAWRLNINIVQTCDPVFLSLQRQKAEARSQKLLCIIPRHNSSKTFFIRVGTLLRERSFGGINILSLQPDDSDECAICIRLAEQTGGAIVAIRTVDDLTEAIAPASFVLTQRYHGAVAATALGIQYEAVSQGDSDKLASISPLESAEDWRAAALRGEGALRMAL